MHPPSGASTQLPPNQPTSSNAAPATPNKHSSAQVQTTSPLQRVGLWDPSYGLRFATTSPAEAQQPAPAPIDTRPVAQPQAAAFEPPHTSTDPTHSGSDAEEGAETTTEDSAYSEPSQSSYRVDSSEEPESTDMGETTSQGETESEVGTEDEANTNTTLAYQIPEDTLRAAMLASPNTRASYWSANLYQGPEGESLSIHYCKTFNVAERVAQYFLKEKVVGFDIEWKPYGNPAAIKQNTSLIQLACEDRIALFHVSLFSGTKVNQLMPPSLKAVLESPDIIKVGVAIKGDFKRVERYLRVHPQGVFELSRLHNLVEWYAVDPGKVSNRLVSLATQVLTHLQLPLYKGEQLEDDPETTSSVRESDWSLPLNLQQIHYAAADAYAAFRLYHMLEWKRTQLTPTPPPVMLCDYDNKPTPRATPRKRAKAATKAKSAVDTDSNSSVGSAEEQDSSQDGEGYETAPEELIDSHELEEPVTAPKSARKAIKNEPSLFDSADPGYPKLPQASQESTKESQSSGCSDSTDNEYADSELEEALGNWTLDEAGNLKEDVKTVAFEQPDASAANVKAQPMQQVASEKDQGAQDATAADLSDYSATSFDLGEDDESASAVDESIVDAANESSRAPEYELATTWAQNYAQSTIPSPKTPPRSGIRATVTHLRAYHLWHHQKMSVGEIARLARDPPLSRNTVTSYILQAVTLEKLEYEQDSLRSLIVALPLGMRNGRWKGLAVKIGASR
ncbi:uncharacterized protein SETTUDRAFT_166226 [Exserohilum turcica Et28A]|uniref:3'-5' exonuclease domain-containing protein n=1 Tax=Exserohilum turcicum (strain 28A) TaxID=671987 RepID=R0JHD1_EXST2|nr:uncharacterized protein SETTUDRAFT_166226 [Exserohilum turcica Et28A]EOA80798.1 hypothetical protein SETTUDRAFT_166226 [Exserohilum turcica Et28A]